MGCLEINPQTREQIDSVLGWMGYSLSYTEGDAGTFVDGPAPADLRTRRNSTTRHQPEASRRVAGSAGNRPDARVVVRQMLEAFAGGLWVCAQLSVRLAVAMYKYASQRLKELRDPDRASQDGPYNDTRPTLRMRMDEGLERVLDALETRARALSPMPALRRGRAALLARAVEADVRIARIWWPDKEREDEGMDVTASHPVASPEPLEAAELRPIHPVSLPKPAVRLGTETRGNIFDTSTVVVESTEAERRPTRDSTPETAQGLGLSETLEPSAASPRTSEVTDDVVAASSESDREDRPWFLRWSSLLSFLHRRETRVPSVFDRSLDLDTGSDDGSGLASELRAQGDFLSVAACEVRPEARKPVTHVHGP